MALKVAMHNWMRPEPIDVTISRLARAGYDGELAEAFERWAGNENFEERVDGVERIDPVVLEALRRGTS